MKCFTCIPASAARRGRTVTFWKRLALAGLLGLTSISLLATCGGNTVVDGSSTAGGSCICRSACAGLPPGATPPNVLGGFGYLCNSLDCPADHACLVGAWSPAEQLYYGMCRFACEKGDCTPAHPYGYGVSCIPYAPRETPKGGVCEAQEIDTCGVLISTYDCHTRIMDYVITCDENLPHDKEYQTHIGPD